MLRIQRTRQSEQRSLCHISSIASFDGALEIATLVGVAALFVPALV
jgi:hypothetical protein